MSNSIYDSARYLLLTAGLNWPATELVLVAWSGPPTFVPADQHIADIVGRGTTTMIGQSLAITQKTAATNGTAQTNQVLIPDVPVGTTVTHFTMCRRQPTFNLSELILYIDEALDLPFDPNGMDLIVNPDWLQNRGWFRP